MFCGILNQTHVANSHTAFGQLFWFSGKCVFVQKVPKRIIQNTPRKGPVFGHMGPLTRWSESFHRVIHDGMSHLIERGVIPS